MPTVRDILAGKGCTVQTTSPAANVMDAIRQMNDHRIGALLVVENGKPVGMFTERDILQRVVGMDCPPSEMRVADVMTRELVCVEPDMDLDDVKTMLRDRRIRHLPVCDSDGTLQGMISIGDVNAHDVTHLVSHVNFLSDYIYGRA